MSELNPVYTKAYKNSRVVIYGKGPVEGVEASCALTFYDGQPRITINTGVRGKEGLINFPSTVTGFISIMSMIKIVAETDLPKAVADGTMPVYKDDKRTNERVLISNLHVGKDKEGIVYLAVIDDRHPKIIFYLKPSYFHAMKDKDGTPLNEAMMSKEFTLQLVHMFSLCVANVMTSRLEEDQPVQRNTGSADSGYKPSNSTAAGPADDLGDITF